MSIKVLQLAQPLPVLMSHCVTFVMMQELTPARCPMSSFRPHKWASYFPFDERREKQAFKDVLYKSSLPTHDSGHHYQ